MRATITLPAGLEAAVREYQEFQPSPPSLSAVVEAALREFLMHRGHIRPGPLRLTPAPHGSGRDDISVEHDRELAGQ
jgi:hypothetical protein